MSFAAVSPAPITMAAMVEQAADYEYRKGLFYVTIGSIRLVFEPDVFMQSLVGAIDCSRQHRPWERKSAEVVSLHQAATGKSSK